MNLSLELSQKLLRAYDGFSKAQCKALGIPKLSMDILLFLANNPEYKTARDIVELRRLKANLVSIHLDRLEQEGYLVRSTVAGDRRKRELRLTAKAEPVVAAGRRMQQHFLEALGSNIPQAQMETFLRVLEAMDQNIDILLKENP